jgi:hypothetical protein
MATSAAGAKTMLMYHGNTLVIANAIQSERLGTEKTMIFTWGCRRHRHATISADHKLHTQNRAYLAERSANLRPVVPEPYLHKRPVPRIAVSGIHPRTSRAVRRSLSLVQSSAPATRSWAMQPLFPPTAAQCSSVRPSMSAAFGSAPYRRSTRVEIFVALVHGPVQCRAALAVAFVG